MGDKKRPSAHQKQIRFLTVLFAVVVIFAAIGIILLLNAPIGGYWNH